MNKWKRFIRRNWLAALIAGSILLTCLSLLYFKHPSSPYHQRNEFFLRFEQIGTLSPGNRVQVNGLTRGKILSSHLTEDAVFVRIEVYAHTSIPENSSFRLINSGLMGEREVCILLGDSEKYLASGDTAIGLYDEGTSGITRKLKEAFTVLDSIMVIAESSLDSLIGGKNGKRISRIGNKGNLLLKETNSLVASSKGSVDSLLSQTEQALSTAKERLSQIKTEGDESLEKLSAMKSSLDNLLSELDQLNERVSGLADSAPMPLIKEETLVKDITKLSKSIENFRKDLLKEGLDINVDIF